MNKPMPYHAMMSIRRTAFNWWVVRVFIASHDVHEDKTFENEDKKIAMNMAWAWLNHHGAT